MSKFKGKKVGVCVPGGLDANTASKRLLEAGCFVVLCSRDEEAGLRALEEMGRMYGLPKERVRQIEARAMRKLRRPSRSACIDEHT